MDPVEVDPARIREGPVDEKGRVSVGTDYAGETVRVAVIETVTTEADVLGPGGPNFYVWDHSTESVAETFESKESAETWAEEHGPEYEPVDATPLYDPDDGEGSA